MKKKLKLLGHCLIVLLFTACSGDDSNENISSAFIGDVILESQAEIDEFASHHYKGVDGMLRITSPGVNSPSNITDVSGLSSLKYVTGNLEIFNNSVTTLDGLENVTEVGGSLIIDFNEELVEIDALANLTNLGGDLVIASSARLTNIQGLLGLTLINGNLSIGIDIGGGALSLARLANLNGLSNITSIGGNAQISGTNIIDLQGLEKINNINGDLNISYNELLKNLNGLENVESIGGFLLITNNPSLQNLNALSNLQDIGDVLQISSNQQLVNIDGLSNLKSADNGVLMFFNTSLISLGTGFDKLENATSISITASFFENIDGFNNLTNSDYIEIYSNLHLVSISGFNSLGFCKNFSIGLNENLQNINGFSNLNSIEEFLLVQPGTISDLPISINAFSNLNTIVGNLVIEGLANTDIDFLSNLETIGNNLNISYNENLSNLCGLNSLIFNNGLSGNFDVFHNLYNPTQQDILNGNCSL